MDFYRHPRLGWRAKLPKLDGKATQAAKTLLDSSFTLHGAKLWNILPEDVNTVDKLRTFKIVLAKFLDRIPDNAPVRGYATTNANSIINWCNQPGGLREKLWPCRSLLNSSISSINKLLNRQISWYYEKFKFWIFCEFWISLSGRYTPPRRWKVPAAASCENDRRRRRSAAASTSATQLGVIDLNTFGAAAGVI